MSKQRKSTLKAEEMKTLSRVQVPPVCVQVKSDRNNGSHYGVSVSQLHAKDKWDLANKLRDLASFIASTEGPGMDVGGAIFVLRR